jgi:hypothetical protein
MEVSPFPVSLCQSNTVLRAFLPLAPTEAMRGQKNTVAQEHIASRIFVALLFQSISGFFVCMYDMRNARDARQASQQQAPRSKASRGSPHQSMTYRTRSGPMRPGGAQVPVASVALKNSDFTPGQPWEIMGDLADQ